MIRDRKECAQKATADFMAESRTLDKAELPLEFLMNALRLNDGVPARYFQERTGLAWNKIANRWLNLSNEGLVEPAGNSLKATPTGLRYLDSILATF